MKKSDLKSGMWVEFRNGGKHLFVKRCETMLYGVTDVFLGHNKFTIVDDFNDNLKCDMSKELDIMKVYYDDMNHVNSRTLNFNSIPLYWERKECTELTISEIEEKIGLEKGTLKIVSNEKE